MTADSTLILTRALDAAEQGGETPEWAELAVAMQALLAQARSAEREKILIRLFAPEPEIRVRPSAHGPHAMSPRNMLRLMAVRALTGDDVEHIRPDLERIVGDPQHPGALRAEAARLLRR